MYVDPQVQYPLFASDLLNPTGIFLDTFSKNLQSSNLMIILLVGAEFLRADGQT